MNDKTETPPDKIMKHQDADNLKSFEIGYQWRSIDGSEPSPRPDYGGEETLNPWMGYFESKQDALKRLKEWIGEHDNGRYILIEVYMKREVDI